MTYKLLKLVTIILTTVFVSTLVECKREPPKLIDDDNRPLKQVSECQFGKNVKELGSTWFADLGHPFGVMYCIKCECVAVPKKKRIVARVQCRNIKNECPPANCDDPILLPGKCCKTCPGDNNTEMIQDQDPQPQNNEEEERNMKHFAALLSGKTSHFIYKDDTLPTNLLENSNNLVATARLNFMKKNLYYSFYVNSNSDIGRPTTIQFVNDVGTILEEHNLTTSSHGPLSSYENITGKICGVWRRIPRDYKRLLREERLSVVLLWKQKYSNNIERAIGGKIQIHNELSTELFSSLLDSPQGGLGGAGGTAIISTTTGAASSIHMKILFNGIFTADEQSDIPINIRIENADRKEMVLEEIQKIKKPSTDINVLEVSSPISIHNLRALSRGKLLLTIESKNNVNYYLQGQIVTRTTCELFQTLLTPPSHDANIKTSGLAWMFLNTDGSLIYNIQTDQLNLSNNPELRLFDGKMKVIEDLTKSLNFNQALGSLDKVAPRIIESLYSEDSIINIGDKSEQVLVKGRLVSKLIADARESAEPILLKRKNPMSSANVMGMAWLSVDNECSLHYDISLTGNLNNNQIYQIYLEEKPIDLSGAPVTRKLLEEFSGTNMEGFLFDLSSFDLIKLESSVCYLEIYVKDSKELILRGKLKSTKVPTHCYPEYNSDNNIPSVVLPGDHNSNALITPETKCFHSGQFYSESDQWKSTEDQCTMCSCAMGKASCEPIKCPALKCKSHEEAVSRVGECCKVCVPQNRQNETAASLNTRGCKLGEQFHMAGSSWHPYLPPNGFDTCTTCTCDVFNLNIRCLRMVCPPLACPEKIAYRPDKKACCKVCPIGKPSQNPLKTIPENPNILRDEAFKSEVTKSPDEILAQGGCKAVNYLYENGQEWHPILASHGEQKCIKCRCKDGKVSCDRKRCSRSCNNGTNRANSNKRKLDANDSDCCTNCRRQRRHQNHKRNHRFDEKITKNTNKS